MNHSPKAILLRILSRKLAVIILMAGSAAAAFATLGDGKIKSDRSKRSLLSDKTSVKAGTFSLKSGYTYRGTQVINARKPQYVNMNTMVSYQRGHTSYVLPMKKKVMLDKVTFNPNASTRN
jgi:hypothetical protein